MEAETDLTQSGGLKKNALRSIQLESVEDSSARYLRARATVDGVEITVDMDTGRRGSDVGPVDVQDIEARVMDAYNGRAPESEQDANEDHPLT